MPLFEYKCTSCGKISEFILRPNQSPEEGCRHCGEQRLEKIQFSKFVVGAAGDRAPCGSGACEMSRGCCPHGACKHK